MDCWVDNVVPAKFAEMRYQFERPFVLDATHTTEVFGLQPTPWEVTLKETVEWLSATAA